MNPEQHNKTDSTSWATRQVMSLGSQRLPRVLVWKALLGLLAFDLLGFGRNFARVHRCVKQWRTSGRTIPRGTVERVCAAVNYACVWYPKRVLCLQRSAVMTCLLRSCGMPATMVLGVQNAPFKAHAWTEVGGRPINERRNVRGIYSVLDNC
jgi:Transglutaminase-like superfamily